MIRRTKKGKLFKIAMKRKYGDNQTLCDATSFPTNQAETYEKYKIASEQIKYIFK